MYCLFNLSPGFYSTAKQIYEPNLPKLFPPLPTFDVSCITFHSISPENEAKYSNLLIKLILSYTILNMNGHPIFVDKIYTWSEKLPTIPLLLSCFQ